MPVVDDANSGTDGLGSRTSPRMVGGQEVMFAGGSRGGTVDTMVNAGITVCRRLETVVGVWRIWRGRVEVGMEVLMEVGLGGPRDAFGEGGGGYGSPSVGGGVVAEYGDSREGSSSTGVVVVCTRTNGILILQELNIRFGNIYQVVFFTWVFDMRRAWEWEWEWELSGLIGDLDEWFCYV